MAQFTVATIASPPAVELDDIAVMLREDKELVTAVAELDSLEGMINLAVGVIGTAMVALIALYRFT